MNVILIFFCLFSFCWGGKLHHHRSENKKLGKIVGGAVIPIEDAPYQLQLENEGWQVCGATIIDKFFALTAASCVDGFDQRELTLRAGTSRHESGGHLYQVYHINIHPQYDYDLHDYDIAVLEVATPFRLDNTTQTINLTRNEPIADTTARVTGWGRTSEEGSESGQLKAVDIPVVGRLLCTEAYAGDVTTRMLCAGIKGKDACQGDTGGPLVQNGDLVGVTSWNYVCAEDGYPGVYVNLANTEIASFIHGIIDG